jgi:hypothetical protein
VTVLSALVHPSAGAAPGTGPAPLQVPGDQVVARATLTGVEPAFVAADEVVTLQGVLRNVSDAPLVDPLPALRLSRDSLESAQDLDLVDSDGLFRYGRVDYDYSAPLPTLDPGEKATFSLAVPLAALVPGPGVYVVGVDVLATLPDGLRVFVASARTTVPVQVEVADPLPTALLWPLAARPSLLPDGSLTDDRLAEELGQGGRLDGLVRAGADAPVTWVMDPDLLATAAAMSDGYDTVEPPGPGAGAEAAAEFLARLPGSVAPGAEVLRLPTADPDAGAMTASDLESGRVTRTLSVPAGSTPGVLSARTPLLADLAQREVDLPTLAAYAEAAVTTVVVPSAAVRVDDDAVVAPLDELPGTTAVRATPLPTAGMPDSVAPPVAGRQRLLATTALLAQAGAPAAVLAPALLWDPAEDEAAALVAAWQDAPWVAETPLERLPVGGDPARLAADLPEPEPLDPAVLDGLDAVAADLARLAPLFPSPPIGPDALLAAQARAFSAQWAGDPEGAVDYVSALGAGLAGAESRLGVVVSPTVTLSSRSGRFPVTIVNESATDVLVGLRFDSQNSSRLRVEDVPAAVLTAGEKRTVTVSAIATANGRVVVTAQLVTAQGDEVGTPGSTIVDVTNVGALGWGVVAVGGLLLVAAIGRNRWRRPPTDGSEPDRGRPAEQVS